MPRKANITGKKGAAVGKRYPLNMRTTFEVRRQLEAGARASGRSLAQEAEFRIDRSFLDQRLMIEALELTYGRELAGILMALGEVMQTTGRQAGFMATRTLEGSQQWWANPYAYSQAVEGSNRIFERLKPEGEPTPPKVPRLDSETLGKLIADSLLREVTSDEPISSALIELAPRLRRSLGPLVERIKANKGSKP